MAWRKRRAWLPAGVIGARRWWRALVAGAIPAAVAAVAFLLLSGGAASAQQSLPVSCQRSGSLYACTLAAGNPVAVPVTFAQVTAAVKAAGGTINVADPAMWITAWGGNGSNGTKCQSCSPDAGAYGPWFWPAVFDLTRKLDGCTSGLHPQTTAGSFYGQTG